jgi:hypothetical protein
MVHEINPRFVLGKIEYLPDNFSNGETTACSGDILNSTTSHSILKFIRTSIQTFKMRMPNL